MSAVLGSGMSPQGRKEKMQRLPARPMHVGDARPSGHHVAATAAGIHRRIESLCVPLPLAVMPRATDRFKLEAGVGIEPAYTDLQSVYSIANSMT